MIAATAFGLDVAEWALVGLALIFVLDTAGISRSGRTARRQNTDLRERNTMLEQENQRVDSELAARDARIAQLDLRITELETELTDVKRRDQGAVLVAIEAHEVNAGRRNERMVDVLTEIRDAVKAA